MAARRALIVALVLLGVSTLVATLVVPSREAAPEPDQRASEDASDAVDPRRAGRLVQAELDASTHRVVRVSARAGDQLALTVRSDVGGQAEIPAFGLIDDVGPGAPARFDVLLTRTGVYQVRLVGSSRVLGRVDVRGADR